MRRVVHVAVLSAVWLGLWFLLVETLTLDELVIGSVCALLAGLATELIWGEHLTSFVAEPHLLLEAWRLPWVTIVDTWSIFHVLALHLFTARKAPSLLLSVPFDRGDEAHAAARGALAIAYTTMTPNFIVIGIDAERGTMLYHQLRKTDVPAMTRRLGARP